MAHWPKTVSGNVFAFLVAFCIVLSGVQLAIALSGPFIWLSLTAVVSVSIALFVWHRRVLTARDLAVADAPSFHDELAHWDAKKDVVESRTA